MFEKAAEEYIKEHTFFDEEYGVQSLDVVSKTIFKDGAEFGYNKAKEEIQEQIEKMKCCEICAKFKDWRNRSLCVECEQSKSHINFELRR